MQLFIAILSYLIGLVGVFIWAYRRSLVPLDDHVPRSDWDLAARFIYVLGYLVSFIGLTGFLVFGGELAAKLVQKVASAQPLLMNIMATVGTQIEPFAPLFAIGAIVLGLKIKPIAELDARVLAWLHNTEYLDDEIAKLRQALIRRKFNPSAEEVSLNHSKLQAHDVRLTDDESIDSEDVFVTLLRKTSCLLRYVKKWDDKTPELLNAEEKAELLDVESTDARKIEHAVSIIKLLSEPQADEQGRSDKIATRRHALSTEGGAALDYRSVQDKQAANLDPVLLPEVGSTYTLEMKSREFLNAIKKIQHYFNKEYDIILARICSLAAKAIVYSGHDAEERLKALKQAGFHEIGSINRLNIDKIIKFFCLTMMLICFSGVLFFVIGDHGGPDSSTIIKLGLVFGFSTLCGAMIGSNRALAKRKSTPWASFIGAGAMSFVLFFLVFFSFAVTEAFIDAVKLIASGSTPGNEIKIDFGKMQIRGAYYAITLDYLLPWTLIPAFVAITICRLARSNPIARGRLENGPGDGLALSGVMVFIMIVTLAFHVKMETEMVHRLFVNNEFQFFTALQGIGFMALLGFLIGFFIIPDVRKIANARI